VVSFDDAIEDYKFIKLGPIDDGFLTSIDQILTHKEHFYIMDKNQHKLFVFNEKGEFVRKLAAQGDGPMEYSFMGPVQIDVKNDRIYLSDQRKAQFLVYDLDLEFVKSIKTPVITFKDFKLFPEENKILLDFMYWSFMANDVNNFYSLGFFELEPFTFIEGYLPYNEKRHDKGNIYQTLFGTSEQLYFRMYDPTFYAFDLSQESKVYPRYQLQFKEGFVDPEAIENTPREEISNKLFRNTPEVMHIQHLQATDQYLHFEYQTGLPFKGHYVVYDLKNKKTIRLETDKKDMRLIQYPIATYQDYFISVVDVSTLAYLSKETDYNTTHPRIPLPAYDLEEDAHFLLLHKLKL
jgi:hypothetical protein